MIYLDNNASTPLSRTARDSMSITASRFVGNPTSDHSAGRGIRRLIEDSRDGLAKLLRTDPDRICFTSGATEANNLAIQGVFRADQSGRLLTTPVEHPSVLEPAQWLSELGIAVDYLQVHRNGLIDLADLENKLARNPKLVSIQWVNNETGVIQPIPEAAALCGKQGIPLQVDAAQAVGKLELRLDESAPYFLSVSGHKFHGPAGIGALIWSSNAAPAALLLGGGQERGLRSGTENWLGIVGLGAAANEIHNDLDGRIYHLADLRDRLERGVLDRIPGVRVVADGSPRVPNTTNIEFIGLDGQALVAQLNGKGICCSQTSACSNLKPEPSYVLRAMGYSENEAYSCVRFSVSVMNTIEEIDQAVELIDECATRLLTFAEGNT